MKSKTLVQELCQREIQRMEAYELAQEEWKQKDIAVELGVTKGVYSYAFYLLDNEAILCESHIFPPHGN